VVLQQLLLCCLCCARRRGSGVEVAMQTGDLGDGSIELRPIAGRMPFDSIDGTDGAAAIKIAPVADNHAPFGEASTRVTKVRLAWRSIDRPTASMRDVDPCSDDEDADPALAESLSLMRPSAARAASPRPRHLDANRRGSFRSLRSRPSMSMSTDQSPQMRRLPAVRGIPPAAAGAVPPSQHAGQS